MIHSVTVTNHLGESLELILTQPEFSGLIVKSIDGMGPSDATINLTEMATVDGSIVNSSRLNSKEIKIDFILLEKPDIETSRQLLYKYFPIKKQIKLTFSTDNRDAYIYGFVEKNEPKIFQKQETVTITIKCPNPYFKSIKENVKKMYGAEPLFEFPFESLMGYEETSETAVAYEKLTGSFHLSRSDLVYWLPGSIRYGWSTVFDTGVDTLTWHIQKGSKIKNVVNSGYPNVYTTKTTTSGIQVSYKNPIGTVNGINNQTITYIPPSNPEYAGIQIKIDGETKYIDTSIAWRISDMVSDPALATLDNPVTFRTPGENPGTTLYNQDGIKVVVKESDNTTYGLYAIATEITMTNSSSTVQVIFSDDLLTEQEQNPNPDTSSNNDYILITRTPFEIKNVIPELTNAGYKNSIWLYGEQNGPIQMVFGIYKETN